MIYDKWVHPMAMKTKEKLLRKRFAVHCPKCGCGDMRVTEVTMVETEKVIPMNVTLFRDGFQFDPNDIDIVDHSTMDEKIRCTGCKAVFSLGELIDVCRMGCM